MNPTQIEELKRLAGAGIKLFPLKDRSKEPRLRWKENATTDTAKISEWNDTWPNANWGAVTGNESGIVVLDVDGEDGRNSLREIISEHDELPATRISKTGKGLHFLFKAPKESLPNRTGMRPGLDIRADGGYIVVPPSIHPNGHNYAWQDEAAEIAELPNWLERAIREKKNKSHALIADTSDRSSRTILSRTRNATLHAEAARLRGYGYEPDMIRPLIQEMNRKNCVLPLDEGEVDVLVDSTSRYEPDDYRGVNHTDAGNAQLMARKYKGQVLYCPDIKSYLIHDVTRYVKDTEAKVEWLMKQTLKDWMRHAAADPDEDRRKRTIQHILKSENQNRIRAAADSLKSEPGISMELANFDRDPWLFNAANGTVDLKTGTLRRHSQEDLMMKESSVVFDSDAKCPHWLKFIDSITNGNKELKDFLQEALGYSLTGDTSEQCLFILHGSGANGKSTFIEIAREVLGDYGMQIPVETLLVRKHEGVGNDVASLRGARFAAASEAEKGQSLAESKIKQLVAGNDKIAARFLYGEFFEYVPQFKIFLATNWMPKISGTDNGIWRRIRLIPFEVAFLDPKTHPDAPEHLRQDRTLGTKLRSELSGILNWMLEGCLRWQKDGLSRPAIVTAATENYKDENDPVGQFITECCEPKGSEMFSTLYAAYLEWADIAKERAISKKEFSQRLCAKTYGKERKGGQGAMMVTGLRLVRVPGLDFAAGSELSRDDGEHVQIEKSAIENL